MDDRVMQDGFRRILTVGDDTSAGFGTLLQVLVLFQSLCFTSLSPSSFFPIDCVSDGDEGGMEMNGWVK